MNKATSKLREEARRLYLTSEMTTNSEIAARLRLKPHTVGAWRKQEDWDGLKLKVDKRAAEMFVEKIATDRVTLNLRHYNYFEYVLNEIRETLKSSKGKMSVKELGELVAIIEKAQKGQRLAKGLSMSGETEETIRAQAHAELNKAIDIVRQAIKENITDEATRDRIGRAILAALPAEPGTGTDDEHDEVAH